MWRSPTIHKFICLQNTVKVERGGTPSCSFPCRVMGIWTLGLENPASVAQICHLLAGWPWSTSLCLIFLLSKMDTICTPNRASIRIKRVLYLKGEDKVADWDKLWIMRTGSWIKGEKMELGWRRWHAAESALWQKMELKGCLSLSDRMDIEAFFFYFFFLIHLKGSL